MYNKDNKYPGNEPVPTDNYLRIGLLISLLIHAAAMLIINQWENKTYRKTPIIEKTLRVSLTPSIINKKTQQTNNTNADKTTRQQQDIASKQLISGSVIEIIQDNRAAKPEESQKKSVIDSKPKKKQLPQLKKPLANTLNALSIQRYSTRPQAPVGTAPCTLQQRHSTIRNCIDNDNPLWQKAQSNRFEGALKKAFKTSPSKSAQFRRDMAKVEQLIKLQERMDEMALSTGSDQSFIAQEQIRVAKEIDETVNKYGQVNLLEVIGAGVSLANELIKDKKPTLGRRKKNDKTGR